MKIKKVEIANIKGISSHVFDLDVFPNKPIILVAPNGFGKTSFSIAFDSLLDSRIDLNKDHIHRKNQNLVPFLRIEYEENGITASVQADNATNNIGTKFRTFVINNKLTAKAKILNISGTRIPVTSMEIETTILIPTIPQRVGFGYNFTESKRNFGVNGKILPNITKLISCAPFLKNIKKSVSFPKFAQVGYTEKMREMVIRINEQSGTSSSVKNWISANLTEEISGLIELKFLIDLALQFGGEQITSVAEAFLSALEIVDLQKRLVRDFNKAIDYSIYQAEKADYAGLLQSVNSTRIPITPTEDGRKLIIRWPKAHEISNGQRDVLSFIALLMKARRTLDADNNVLVIDEIFDYLDDANLVTFQYFVTAFIEDIKASGKNIFPIMLTHLDPNHFQHFCFNRHKMQIRYLQGITNNPNGKVLNLIKKRDEPMVKADLDLYFFHYHPDKKELLAEFSALGLFPGIAHSDLFYTFVRSEVNKYLSAAAPYCPFSVCFALRIKIEGYLFNRIHDPIKEQAFLECHGTNNKIDYCDSIGIDSPEIVSLLGIIYNDKLHWHNNYNVAVPLAIKLENITIRSMIESVFQL